MHFCKTFFALAVVLNNVSGSLLGRKSSPQCRCIPGDGCWPSEVKWNIINQTLDHRLIKTQPIALPCYKGPAMDPNQCSIITSLWTNQDFQTSHPIGRPFPYNITCPPQPSPPINNSNDQSHTSNQCSLGQLPVYAVNATTRSQIRRTLLLAKYNNLRLAVTSTGHDLLGRADGYGSLELWLRHYRREVTFYEKFKSLTSCRDGDWTGSVIHIDGSWQWKDVYKVARENNVIVVGAGTLSVAAVGGWSSGGGHGPATREYGLGADQILEAEVMLADGRVIVANSCENRDLFRAVRGGGPGYGVVLSQTVKAYPNIDVMTAHRLAIVPRSHSLENKDLLDAVAVMIQGYPRLNEVGWAGYAAWQRNFPGPFIGDSPSGYAHTFSVFGKGRREMETAFGPLREALERRFEGRLVMNESFVEYDDYWKFYYAESGDFNSAGDTGILTSRLVNKEAVQDFETVRETVGILAGTGEEIVTNVILLVSGGKVFTDAADATSGLNPTWRKCSFVMASGKMISRTASNEERRALDDDVTYVKGAALKKMAPGTGAYMNEADRNDGDYVESFYGDVYEGHLETKRKYDGEGMFYCKTCVGSEMWRDSVDGALCRV